jgi:hypothetical protein
MTTIAPRSSKIATAARKTLSDGATRAPSSAADAERERDVGCHRNPPAAQRDRIIPVNRGVDQRRDDHPAERGDQRQRRLAHGGELADEELALDLEADEEKEDRHPELVDPDRERLREHQPGIAEAQLATQREHLGVPAAERRVGDDDGDERGQRQATPPAASDPTNVFSFQSTRILVRFRKLDRRIDSRPP